MHTTSKAEQISALKNEFNRWQTLLDSLSEEQINAPNLDENWSIKDVIAHLWAWQQRSIARMEAAQQNREPVFPRWSDNLDPEVDGEPDDLNAWLYQFNKDKPWSQVYNEWKTGFHRFIELSEAIPENDLLQAGKYAWLEDHALTVFLQASQEHHAEHYDWLTDHLRRGGHASV